MINNLLKKGSIQIINEVKNWEEAIKLSFDPLIKGGYVEKRYVETIIKLTREIGAYYVITPLVALPHARPEMGVVGTQIALLSVKKPIYFSEKKFNVRLIFSLATVDSTSHLEALMEISNILRNDKIVEQLLNANSVDEITDILNS